MVALRLQRLAMQIAMRRRAMRERPPSLRRQKRMPAQQHPKTIELRYATFIMSLLTNAQRLVLAEVPDLQRASRLDDLERADSGEDVRRIFNGIRITVADTTNDQALQRNIVDVGRATDRFQEVQLERQVQATMGVAVPLEDPNIGAQLRSWTAENVALVKSVPGDMLDELERTILNGVNTGQRWETIAGSIQERFRVAENRAALIARDQVGKFYGTVQRARQTNIGVTHYVWRTSGDERVREEHAVREGQTFAWDDPPEDGHPGQPINCRCTAEPVLSSLLDMLEAEDAA